MPRRCKWLKNGLLGCLARKEPKRNVKRLLRGSPLRLEALEDRLTPTLGTASLLEGQPGGSDADIVTFPSTWSAVANAAWLRTTASGTGNGLATFTFDANTGATRTGTLTIAGQTLTVTQAGSTYVVARPLKTLVSGLDFAEAVAVDASGNVYAADDKSIKEYNPTTQHVTTLVSSGLLITGGVAVDAAGNVYVSDTDHNAIKVYSPVTQQVTTLITSVFIPEGVAVDAAGNVYIADNGDGAIKEYNPGTRQITTLVAEGSPYGVAVDASGNVYFTEQGLNAIKVYNSSTHQVTTLVSGGLNAPLGLAVDASGNVYVANSGNSTVTEYVSATQQLATLATGVNFTHGDAVDASGNVYIADSGDDAIKELPRAFVPAAAVSEDFNAGSDSLLPVLATTERLTGVFAPTSDQSWLTIGTVANGVINFSFTANSGAARTAHISVLGQKITINQGAVSATLDVSDGALTYTATSGFNNDLTLSATTTDYSLTETAEPIVLTANAMEAGWMVSSDGHTATGPIASVSTDNFEISLGDDDADTFNVQNTPNATPVNAILESSNTIVVNVGNAGSMQGILGALTLSNPGGSDDVTVDDSADSGARTATLSAAGGTDTISGLSPAAINYVGGDTIAIAIDGGSGGNTFNVQSDGDAITAINSGSGNDTINVSSDAPINTGDLSGLGGTLTIDAGAGSNTLAVSESGSATVNEVMHVTGSEISSTVVPFTIDYSSTGGTYGTIDVSSSGNISLDGGLSATETVAVSSAMAIVNGAGAGTDVTASNLALSAGTGIGTSVAPIETEVSNLVARNSTSGGIFILNSGNLTIGFTSAPFLGVIDSGAAVDAISLTNNGSVSIPGGLDAIENVKGPGAVTIAANGVSSDLTISNRARALSGVVGINNQIVSGGGLVTLAAGRDVIQDSTAYGGDVQGQGVVITAGRDYLNNGAYLDATGAGNVSVFAGRNIALNNDPSGSGFSSRITTQGGTIVLEAGQNAALGTGSYTMAVPGGASSEKGGLRSVGGNITIDADLMTISGLINAAAGAVALEVVSAGRGIDLGANPSNGKLGIAQSDWTNISAGILSIGGSTNGGITVTASVNPSNVPTLELATTGAIAGGGHIAVTNLALQATDGIGSSITPIVTQVSNLVALNRTSGGIFILNSGNLTIGFIGAPFLGVIDSGTAADAISLTNNGSVSIPGGGGAAVETVKGPGAVTIAAPGAGSDLTINDAIRGVTGGVGINNQIVSGGGLVTLAAGRDVIQDSTAYGGDVQGQGVMIIASRDFLNNGAYVDATGDGNVAVVVGRNITLNNDPAGLGFSSRITTQGGTIGLEAGQNAALGTGSYTMAVPGGESGEKGGLRSMGGNITITADLMTIRGLVNAAAGTVALEVISAGRGIDLGANPSNGKLGIAQSDLTNISAGILNIGGGPTGGITVTASVNPSNVPTLELSTSGAITGGGQIVVTNLALQATGESGGFAVQLTNTANAVANLAARVSNGAIEFVNGASLSIGGPIPGLSGITSANNAITVAIVNAGLTVANEVNAGSAGVHLTAGGEVSINVNVTGSSVAVDGNVSSGTGVSFGAGAVVDADTQEYHAGISTGSAVVNFANATFNNTADNGAPTNFTYIQDARISDTEPTASQYFGSTPAPTLSLLSDNGGVTINTAANVAGSNLTLTTNLQTSQGQVDINTGLTLASLSVSVPTGLPSIISLSGVTIATTTAAGQSYSGAIVLNGNPTLDASAGNGAVTIDNGVIGHSFDSSVLTIKDGSGASSISGGVKDGSSGTTSLTISGGTVTLNGSNGYSGATTINNGATLKLGNTSAASTFSAVTDNGTLDLNSFAETIASFTGNGTVINTGGGSDLFDITGAATFGGTVKAGALTVGGATAINTTCVTTTGAQDYTSGVTLGVPQGSTVNLITTNSTVTVGGNLILGATASTATDTLQITGAFSFANSATLTSTFAGTGNSQFGHVNVSNSTNFNGATLALNYASFSPAPGKSFDVVSNGVSHTGQFNNAMAPGLVTLGGVVYLVTYSGNGGNDFVVTVGTPPMVTSPTVSSPAPGNFTATLGGDVTSEGDAPILERGVLFAKTSANLDLVFGVTGVTEVDDAAMTTGTFADMVNALEPGTGYSFVAFATNGAGTTYTSVSSFTTTQTPATGIGGLTNAFPGQAITLTLLASDPSAGMQTSRFAFHINWGDGAGNAVTSLTGATTNHTYANPGTYVIQISATDARGNVLPFGTLTVVVSRAQLVGSTLEVFGTAGNDTIVLTAPSPGSIDVSENGVDQGTFSPTAGVVIENSGGTDTLQGPNAASVSTWTLSGSKSGTLMNAALPATVSFSGITNLTGGTGPDDFVIQDGAGSFGTANGGSGLNTLDYSNLIGGSGVTVNLLTRSANDFASITNFTLVVGSNYADMLTADNTSADTLVGGKGNDTLVGGKGADVLLGGAGRDVLTAGAGRSLLVGGSGADTLTGGAADDVLIGGLLSYYSENTGILDITSLSAIMAEWTSGNESTLAARTAALMNGGSLNGTAVLNSTTISDDCGAGDSLNEGSSAAHDWFFIFANDTVLGAGGSDMVTNLA